MKGYLEIGEYARWDRHYIRCLPAPLGTDKCALCALQKCLPTCRVLIRCAALRRADKTEVYFKQLGYYRKKFKEDEKQTPLFSNGEGLPDGVR